MSVTFLRQAGSAVDKYLVPIRDVGDTAEGDAEDVKHKIRLLKHDLLKIRSI